MNHLVTVASVRGDWQNAADRLDPVVISMIVDELDHHFEFYRNLGNLSAAFNQIYDSSAKLWRAAPACRLVLLSG